jgi:threonine synthase
MTLHLFTAEDFVERVQHADHRQVQHFGMREASFVDAFNHAGKYAGERGLVSERGFFNLGRREGLKLAFFEATDQVHGPIDWYVQAVSSAMGVYGTYKGAKELRASGTSTMCRSSSARSRKRARRSSGLSRRLRRDRAASSRAAPAGIAEAILRGDPSRVYPYVKAIVVESGGDFVAVTEDEIREARRVTEELEGFRPAFPPAPRWPD